MAQSEILTQLNLTTLTDEELEELLTKVQTAFEGRVQKRIEEFRHIAGKAGYMVTLSKISQPVRQDRDRRGTDRSPGRNQQQQVLPKYRNPDNPSQTWAGRGHRPRWVEDWLAARQNPCGFGNQIGRLRPDLSSRPSLMSRRTSKWSPPI